MEAQWRREIMGMEDKVSGEESGGRAWWRKRRTTGIDTAAEEMRDGSRRYVERQRWRNGLEEWQRTGKVLTGNDCQYKGVSLPQ